MKCSECGKEIKNPYYINGKAYGYSCYKMKLAIIYKQWEDENNKEYSVKCFSAMQVFEQKKGNSFHDSICKQWNECKKLTAKQLECIIKGFSVAEKIQFYTIWQPITNDDITKRSIPSWLESEMKKNDLVKNYMENEAVHNVLLDSAEYKYGFYYWKDIDDCIICISGNGKNNKYLDDALQDEYTEVLRVIKCI